MQYPILFPLVEDFHTQNLGENDSLTAFPVSWTKLR